MTIPCLTLSALLVCIFIFTKPLENYGFNIKLIPIDRFDTELFPQNLTLEERYQKISFISQARVQQLEYKARLGSISRKLPIEHGLNTLQPPLCRHITGYYVTTILVGTYSYAPFLVVDTASDDTWMQCEGCTDCFPTARGNFNRSRSLSYHPLPYDNPLCVPKLQVNGSCAYDNRYGYGCTNCYSKGLVGLDTFIFKDDKRSVKGFHNTVFGCGLKNRIAWARLGQNNTISGILGLGLGMRSIFSQYINETKKRVSYCLPSWYSLGGTYTLLQFGDDAQIGQPGATVRTTALIQHVNTYAVNVVGVSISGKHLNIDPAVFRLTPNGTGGFLIDTGSPHTVLVRTAYDVVKGEITQYFLDKYKWHPRPPQPEKFDLCYDLPHGNYTYPSMTFHFASADLFLDHKNVFQFFHGGFCLIMLPIHDRGTSLLGAFQQANYRFLFDFRAFTASFVPEVCHYHEETNNESTSDSNYRSFM